MNLVGMFFVRNLGESYQTGEVVGEPTPGNYLIRLDAVGDAPITPLQLTCACTMTEASDDGSFNDWQFFLRRQDLEAWLAWLLRPEKETEPKSARVSKKDLQ